MTKENLDYDPLSLYVYMFQSYPDVVNIKQMCVMLGGISSKTAYKLLRAGRIKHFKIGREYRIPKVYIIAYLRSLLHPGQPNDFDGLLH